MLHLEVKLANEVAEWLQIEPAGPSSGGKPQHSACPQGQLIAVCVVGD